MKLKDNSILELLKYHSPSANLKKVQESKNKLVTYSLTSNSIVDTIKKLINSEETQIRNIFFHQIERKSYILS